MNPWSANPNAIGIWRSPGGKPWTKEVAKWSRKKTIEASYSPKFKAQKYPAAESKAIVETGLELLLKNPLLLKLWIFQFY
jgi:hypothetical protein